MGYECGGLEVYVQSRINGYLCDFDTAEISNRAAELIKNEVRYSSFLKVVGLSD